MYLCPAQITLLTRASPGSDEENRCFGTSKPRNQANTGPYLEYVHRCMINVYIYMYVCAYTYAAMPPGQACKAPLPVARGLPNPAIIATFHEWSFAFETGWRAGGGWADKSQDQSNHCFF